MEKGTQGIERASASSGARDYLRRNVLALVALFFALSGGAAWATHPGGANTISSDDIIDNEVRSADINAGAVTTADIGNSEVRSIDVLDDSLTGADIAPDAVGTSEVAPDSLGAADIAADAVGTSEVDGTLTGAANIANGSVSTTDLTDESVSQNDLGANSVRGGQLGDVLDGSIQDHDIGNMTRTLNIPITSFVNCTGEEQIGFADDAGGPNLDTAGVNTQFGRSLFLKWDGPSPPSQGDLQAACTTITIPRDFAFFPAIRLTSIAGGNNQNSWTGQTTVQSLGEPEDTTVAGMNGGTNCDLGITDGDVYRCGLGFGDSFEPGDAVTIAIRRTGLGNIDQRLYAVDFEYTATR
jgi:hypothetical protein